MFPYSDPSSPDDEEGILASLGALEAYRSLLELEYGAAARSVGSAFTRLEAFDEVGEGGVETVELTWRAFPKRATARNAQIDRNRFLLQDEYVEWATVVRPEGGLESITFSTDFPEFYEALAAISSEAVIEGVRSVFGASNPTVRDLYGIDGTPDALDVPTRQQLLRRNLRRNPWNTGDRILCLTQQNNTLSALFALLKDCGIPRAIQADAVCGVVPCVPERDSDPKICSAAQQLGQAEKSFTVADPVGIRILNLSGIWKLGGREIDINDPRQNEGLWRVTRNGRRAELVNHAGLTMDSRKITSGAQVSANLRVGVQVLAASENLLPIWARAGNEGMRQ